MDDRDSPSFTPLQEQAAKLVLIQSELTAEIQKSIDETNELLRRISEGKGQS
jgi:hypothetical protein